MKKVIVIGCPGSGKSTFSRRLHSVTGLPLYHLDTLFWLPDGTSVSREVFLSKLHPILAEDGWIIDGNFANSLPKRVAACDTVFFFDIPAPLCLEGIRARRGKPRPDLPWVEPEEDDAEFMAYVQNFDRDTKPALMALLSEAQATGGKTVITFTTRAGSDRYLEEVKVKVKR